MKTRVGILGATGAVGQRFVQLLDGHPWFEVTALAASTRSAGRPYAEACHWILDTPMPAWAGELEVLPASPDASFDCQMVFSALPGNMAREVEEQFAQAGHAVCSNASAHRMDPDVPLIIPEVNAEHLGLIEAQRRARSWEGFIVTAANCSTTHLALALKPLDDAYGIIGASVVTMQAISGAGYPGVPSLDILGNVVPYISGEEPKLEAETQKLLGTLANGEIIDATFVISAHCNRVPVINGHTECVSISFKEPPSAEGLKTTLAQFRGLPQELGLPSAPEAPILVTEAPDRPQPRLDIDLAGGMATVVGRVRPCPLFDYRFVLLGHNTVRGAAGGAILNAELLAAQGYVS
jgi:aspartate-semialdehyde dehydrogenase